HDSSPARIDFQQAVKKVLDYIGAGDVFQVNLSQRFELPMRRKAAEVYRDMRRRYPAGFGALLDYGNRALISNSPELFLRVDADQKVTTRPIKGTRPRREGMERELRGSAKDQAELNMIVDLERNDLGRVCEIGSIKVTNPREIETLPTVYHGVATIEGQLRKDVGLVELLWATFPGGSVTGAPKIRAMEIIEELEPVRRGPYCGAIGYLSADGQMQFNVAIRTIVVNQGRAYVSVGGGIVADSNPADEYDETMVKAQAMFDVLK
ncbi:MAG TPA: aminodeoxychorismate synthase component I, partial [Tepidisphaeraceae bacterium]|nr:aminodeoxychorismate synthase component I [Tepidisphaeraceae bacterium]